MGNIPPLIGDEFLESQNALYLCLVLGLYGSELGLHFKIRYMSNVVGNMEIQVVKTVSFNIYIYIYTATLVLDSIINPYFILPHFMFWTWTFKRISAVFSLVECEPLTQTQLISAGPTRAGVFWSQICFSRSQEWWDVGFPSKKTSEAVKLCFGFYGCFFGRRRWKLESDGMDRNNFWFG